MGDRSGPIRVLGDEPAAAVPAQATVLIARIARVVRQRFEQALTPLQMRQRHVVALSYLREHGATPQQMLADRLRMDPSSMVGLLNELEEQGLVVRQRDRSDRRRGIIELSADGERMLSRVDGVLEDVEEELLRRLESQDRRRLHDLLAQLNVDQPDWGLVADDG